MRILSLLPFAIFIGVFLGCGIAYGNFYKLPAPIAVLAGIIVAFLLFYKNGINRNMDTFIGGCGDKNIVMMCIFCPYDKDWRYRGGISNHWELPFSEVSICWSIRFGIVFIVCFGDFRRCNFYPNAHCSRFCGYQ